MQEHFRNMATKQAKTFHSFQLSSSQVNMVLLRLLSISQLARCTASVNNHLNNQQRNAGASDSVWVSLYRATLMTPSMGPMQHSANFFSLASLGGTAEDK